MPAVDFEPGDLVMRVSKEVWQHWPKRPNAPFFDMPENIPGIVVSDYGRSTGWGGLCYGVDPLVCVLWSDGNRQEHVYMCHLEGVK